MDRSSRPGSPTWQRDAAATLAESLALHYARLVAEGLLRPGARLPSVRRCAQRHQVSPSTVVAAYDQLQAQGLIEAQRQRGFFVRPGRGAAPALPARPLPPAPVDATALMRGMFAGHQPRTSPGSGTLPPAWLDGALLQRALRRACSDADAALRYGEPAGDPALRSGVAQRLADLGIPADPAQVVTTSGATHALDLIARTLLQPGDAVLVDEPGWAIEFARLSRMGMHLLPVPRGPAGPDLDAMARLAEAHAPRLYVTVSVLHNPTGASLSLSAAHQVLQLAQRHDFHIVEDDAYGWLAPPHAPRLAALDGLRRTLYVGGFSKILVPNWRVGCLAAPPALVDRLVDAKLVGALTTPGVTEQAVAWCLTQGLLRRHADRVVERLARARSRSCRLAIDAGCTLVTPPDGLFGWVDAGVDTDALAQRMAEDGWLLAPGSLFLVGRPASTRMRINFATTQDPGFWTAFAQARDRLRAARRPA